MEPPIGASGAKLEKDGVAPLIAGRYRWYTIMVISQTPASQEIVGGAHLSNNNNK